MIDEGVEVEATEVLMVSAARQAANFRGFGGGRIGIRITDDVTIRDLNKTHLGHDYATDVISFSYSAGTNDLCGELVASAETAARLSRDDWTATAELSLYIVHGTLHITGMDDQVPEDRRAMRDAEEKIMKMLGFPHIDRFGADQFDGEARPSE